jgi:hypothetical protein
MSATRTSPNHKVVAELIRLNERTQLLDNGQNDIKNKMGEQFDELKGSIREINTLLTGGSNTKRGIIVRLSNLEDAAKEIRVDADRHEDLLTGSGDSKSILIRLDRVEQQAGKNSRIAWTAISATIAGIVGIFLRWLFTH